MPFTIRQATYNDLPEMKELYVDTITTVCTNDYDASQIEVWSSSIENTQRWLDLINNQLVLVALKDKTITGFCSLENNVYIDFMYVHKNYQRQGIADILLSALEEQAKNAGTTLLTSDISKTARPFFEKRGFAVVTEQINLRKGIEIINYKMRKELF